MKAFASSLLLPLILALQINGQDIMTSGVVEFAGVNPPSCNPSSCLRAGFNAAWDVGGNLASFSTDKLNFTEYF